MLEVLAAVLGFITVAALGFAVVGGGDSSDRALKRAAAFTGPRAGSRARTGKTAAQANTPEQRRKQIMLQLKEADRKERKARLTLGARMRQAGLAGNVRMFWMISAVLAVVSGFLALVLGLNLLLVLGVAAIFGLGLPRWALAFLAQRRMKKFSAEFPNAIDTIVRGIKSGLPVHDGLKIIGRESPAPLGPEFQKLVEGIGVGLTLEQALEKMYERMPTPELRFFTIVVGIQAKTGGNLAEALGNLSNVLRSRAMMREKIKALSSEATASAGIIGALPPAVMTMVFITTPAYMGLLFTDMRGQLMLMGAALWMSIGVFVMKRMIAFKF